MKKAKAVKQWHTSRDQMGKGDDYNQGIRQPVGHIRSLFSVTGPINLNKKGKPPRSLA